MEVKRKVVVIVGLISIFCLQGCRPSVTDVSEVPKGSRTERGAQVDQDPLLEQLKAGQYQIELAKEDLANSLLAIQKLKPTLKGTDRAGLEDAIDMLDGAGARLSDFDWEIPPAEHFKAARKRAGEQRKKWIDGLNDSLFESKQTINFLESLLDFGTGKVTELALAALTPVKSGRERMKMAIEELGGDVEPDGPSDL